MVPPRWDDQTPAPNPGKLWPICADNEEFALCVWLQEVSKARQV